MKKFVISVAIGATIVSTAAVAQDRGGRGLWMQDMTRVQSKQNADMMFQRFDANHDGSLTRAEAEQAMSQFGGGERTERMLDRLFGTGQSVTLQQFEAQALARFDAMDLNHDGTVTVAERQQARAQREAQRAAPQTAPAQPSAPAKPQ